MALRPFAKHQKRKADDDDNTPSAADEFAQFFSNDPRPDDPPTGETPPGPTEQPTPSVTMKEHSAAGWYPDSNDPGLMRYWDGFHLTGQTMRVDPARPVTPESGEATATVDPIVTPAPSATELLAPDQPKVPLLGSQLLPPAADAGSPRPEQVSPVRSEPSGAPVDAPAVALEAGESHVPSVAPATPATPVAPANPVNPANPVTPVAPVTPVSPVTPVTPVAPVAPPVTTSFARMTSPMAPTAPEPADSWAERTEQAFLRAQAAGTPEAWQEAAQAAAVVSELALTMQVAADLRRSAEQLDEAAEEARRRAEEAGEQAAEAQRSVQKTAQAAKEAADAAAAASRAATEAKQKAERATEAMPRVAARSNDAAQAAAAAKRKVQLVDEIVTRATRADTPEAWSEAHRSADRATESRPAQVAGS